MTGAPKAAAMTLFAILVVVRTSATTPHAVIAAAFELPPPTGRYAVGALADRPPPIGRLSISAPASD